jgi:hypothetical protein
MLHLFKNGTGRALNVMSFGKYIREMEEYIDRSRSSNWNYRAFGRALMHRMARICFFIIMRYY